MEDIIHLLPDNIANQIAAGEVIQRPASAVKELLENAVDAGADEIRLLITDAGKTLVQVIDNGKGMSDTDARMAFERHATSKIRGIEDLFHIRTMGFRGEALASMAAVAQMTLKTKRPQDPAGTRIDIENSAVKLQEPVAMQNGTSIAMKNLFFNVPARRNFLKSNAAELRHIVDEFTRVAMAFPDIHFSLSSNGQEVFHLEKGSLKQRILQLMGSHYNARLVSVQENTDYLNISGFVGKPDTAKKTRGDQYFFVNNRFIKSPYLHHAIMQAFSNLIPKDSFPMYALFIELDPEQVDINVHPTKQEIKFEDEKIVYAFVQSAVKHALAQFSITPTLDFELDAGIQQLDSIQKPVSRETLASTAGGKLYEGFTRAHQAHFIEKSEGPGHWQHFFNEKKEDTTSIQQLPIHENKTQQGPDAESDMIQLWLAYIMIPSPDGYWLVHQQLAHERILFERYQLALSGTPVATQQSLFPATVELNAADAQLVMELLPDLKRLGYQLEPFGIHSFIIQGTPADVETGQEKHNLELILDQYKHFSTELRYTQREKLLRSMAWQQAIKEGTKLSLKEMQQLVSSLFSCNAPNSSPNGRPTYSFIAKQEVDKRFGR